MKVVNSFPQRVLLFTAALFFFTSFTPPAPELQIGTDLNCTFTARIHATGGSCGAATEPSAVFCVTVYGPNTMQFNLPGSTTVVQRIELYCGDITCGTAPPLAPVIAIWDCLNGTTTGTCCDEVVGIYGDQPTGGWRIEP